MVTKQLKNKVKSKECMQSNWECSKFRNFVIFKKKNIIYMSTRWSIHECLFCCLFHEFICMIFWCLLGVFLRLVGGISQNFGQFSSHPSPPDISMTDKLNLPFQPKFSPTHKAKRTDKAAKIGQNFGKFPQSNNKPDVST